MITDFIEMKAEKEKSNIESAVGSKDGKASGRTIKTTICLKYDTYENWALNNPILRVGEVGTVVFDKQLVKIKIGDGIRHFLDLPYVTF